MSLFVLNSEMAFNGIRNINGGKFGEQILVPLRHVNVLFWRAAVESILRTNGPGGGDPLRQWERERKPPKARGRGEPPGQGKHGAPLRTLRKIEGSMGQSRFRINIWRSAKMDRRIH